MALDGLITQTGTGPDVTASIQEEVTGLWNRSVRRCESVGGTGDAITCTVTPDLSQDVVDGMQFLLVPAANNTGAVTLAINGGTAIDVVDAFGEPLEAGELVQDRLYTLVAEGGELRVAAGSSSSGGGGGYRILTYAASDTWIKPDGLVKVRVRVRGGGGGGGGKSSATGVITGGGGGGGGEAIVVKNAADLGTTETVTVGSGGAGAGTTSGNTGGTGGTSSFGTHAVATGGTGGATNDTGGSRFPGLGGNGTSGDILMRGSIGHHGDIGNDGYEKGAGGASPTGGWGGASPTSNGTANAGGAGTGGGGGGGRHSSTNTQIGGAGGSGLVIVEEFY